MIESTSRPIHVSTMTAVVCASIRVDARLVVAPSAYARNVRDRRERAGGMREPRHPLHEPRPEPIGVRRERQEERRDADRERADQRQVSRQEREREPATPTASDSSIA